MKRQKTRADPAAGSKRKASPAAAGCLPEDMEITPTSDTVMAAVCRSVKRDLIGSTRDLLKVMAVALVLYCVNAANPEGLLEFVVSPHVSRTDVQHEAMH